MGLRKGILVIVLFCSLYEAAATLAPAESKKNAGGVADVCKALVDTIEHKLEIYAQKSRKTQIIWNFWHCLGDTEIKQDAYALCNVIGAIIGNITHFEMAIDYFLEQQLYTACDLCDSTANRLQKFSDGDMKLLLQWAEGHVQDPNTALALRQHGPVLATKILQSIFPYEECNDLNAPCTERRDSEITGQLGDFQDFLKELMKNVTACTECNLCENAVLFAEVDILPNPKLPGCMVDLVQNNICILFNVSLPGLGNKGYEICVGIINQLVGNIVDAMRTFLHPSLVCNSMLKVCDADHNDQIFECICDTIKLPKLLNLFMPCHWQHDK